MCLRITQLAGGHFIGDDMDSTTVFILLVIFIATLIRSTFGFGESLIAVPLLILFIPIEIAVPLSVLLSITIAAVIVAQDRKQFILRVQNGWWSSRHSFRFVPSYLRE